MLTTISKQIIQSRLLDKNINVTLLDLDNILIDPDSFKDNNTMYNFIVSNWGILIIN